MQLKKDASIDAIYGMRGMGKTSLLHELSEGHARIVGFDPLDQFEGMRRVDTVDQLARSIGDNWDAFALRIVPPEQLEVEALDELCAMIWELQRAYKDGLDDKPLLLVVDEMNLSYPLRQPKAMNAMTRLVNQGRHAGVSIIGASQRPAEVSPTFRGNAERSYFFKHGFANDIQTVIGMIGRENSEALRTLHKFQYLRLYEGEVSGGVTKKFN